MDDVTPYCEIQKRRSGTWRCRLCKRHYSADIVLPLRAACPKKKKQEPGRTLTFWNQVKNVSSSMATFAKEGFMLCVKDHWEARMDVCRKCPHLKRNRCSLCGCPFMRKSRSPSWHCPDPKGDRWADVDAEFGFPPKDGD